MGNTLPGEHYCGEHQGNTSHYHKHNCTVCKLKSRVVELEKQHEEFQTQVEAHLDNIEKGLDKVCLHCVVGFPQVVLGDCSQGHSTKPA